MNKNEIIPNQTVKKIIYCSELYAKANRLLNDIASELTELGFDVEKLCTGDGNGFEEIERGCLPDFTTWKLDIYSRRED